MKKHDFSQRWVQAIHHNQVDLLIDIYACVQDTRRTSLLLDVKDIGVEGDKNFRHTMTDQVAQEVLQKLGPIIKKVGV